MWQRTLIVDPGDDAADLVSTAARAEVEPVLLCAGASPAGLVDAPVLVEEHLDHNVITRLARDERVRGIYAVSARAWPEVAASAARLGLPAMAPGKAESFIVSHAGAFREQRVACVETVLAADETEAEEAAGALGLPVRLRTAGWADSPRCILATKPEDLSAAIARVRRHSTGGRLLVQRYVEGAHVRVLGFKSHGAYLPVEALREACTEDAFCVPMLAWAPATAGAQREQLMQLAQRAAAVLPHGTGYLELEFICGDHGAQLGGVRAATGPHPAVRRLLNHAIGADLVEQGLRLAAGMPPRHARPAHRAAALCWLHAKAGMVDHVSGVDRARQYAGIQAVEVAARPGDVLGRIVDVAARDRVGYVLAEAATAREALEAARYAARLVHVVTRPEP